MRSPFNDIKCTVTALLFAGLLSGPVDAQQRSLDELFVDLSEADASDHARIANLIRDRWLRSGSPSMDLLYRRGKEALDEGDARAAVEHFTALVDHAPEFAEGYHARASAYFAMDLVGPALEDLRTTLALTPRHFEALFGFGAVLEGLDRPRDALDIYRRVLEIYPLQPEALDGVERLEVQLEGQSL